MDRREIGSASKDCSIGEKSSNHGKQTLQFVPIQDFGQAQNPAIQKLVRQHAMRDFRRRTKKRQEDRYLDITPLLRSARRPLLAGGQTKVPPCPPTFDKLEAPSTQPRLFPAIAASSVNPFVPLPISPTARDGELFHHLFEDTCAMFKTMRNVGFFTTMMDSAGFHQALSCSAWHQAWLRGEDDQVTEHIPHHIAAVQFLNRRLAHPVLGTSDETIGLVVAFACQAIMTGDIPAWKVHIDGLEEMVRRRGGLAALLDKLLRLMLHWVDVSGACSLDAVPRFPIPMESLPKIPIFSDHSFRPLAGKEATTSPGIRNDETVEIFRMLHALNKTIAAELSTRDLWSDPVWPVLYLTPLLHRLLSFPHAEGFGSDVQDAYRVAAILYLREIQRKFGITTTPADIYISKLQSILTHDPEICNWDPDILLWVLIMCGIGASSMTAERSWFARYAIKILRERGVRTCSDVTVVISQNHWIPEVFDASRASFVDEVILTFNSA